MGLCAVWPLNDGQSEVSWGLQCVCESGSDSKAAAHVEKVQGRKGLEEEKKIGCGRVRGS